MDEHNTRVENCIARAEDAHAYNVTEPPRGYYVDADGVILKKGKNGFSEVSSEDECHRGAEIIRYINDGLGWSKEDPYTNSYNLKIGGFSWCGAFAAWCDITLSAELRKKVLPSTYRLWEFCKGTARSIPLDEIQRGDIVVVGKKGGKRWGAHITRALEVGETHVSTIEGNAHGRLGSGLWGEGVVTRQRPFKGHNKPRESYIMYAYRFLDEDYEA